MPAVRPLCPGRGERQNPRMGATGGGGGGGGGDNRLITWACMYLCACVCVCVNG